MQSVGEVMAIGRTFPESLQKALRSLEQGRMGLNCDPAEQQLREPDDAELLAQIAIATPERIFQIGELLRRGVSIDDDPRRVPHRSVVHRPDGDHHRRAGRARRDRVRRHGHPRVPPGQAAGVLRRPARVPVGHRRARRSAPPASRSACCRPTRRSTPAPPSSPPRRRTTTRRTRTRPRCVPPIAARS